LHLTLVALVSPRRRRQEEPALRAQSVRSIQLLLGSCDSHPRVLMYFLDSCYFVFVARTPSTSEDSSCPSFCPSPGLYLLRQHMAFSSCRDVLLSRGRPRFTCGAERFYVLLSGRCRHGALVEFHALAAQGRTLFKIVSCLSSWMPKRTTLLL